VVSDRRADAVRRVVNDLIRTHNPPNEAKWHQRSKMCGEMC
jgi:hypothetical protein